ncbi:MAG: DUF6265 family protein [Phycisphaerae bacterium]
MIVRRIGLLLVPCTLPAAAVAGDPKPAVECKVATRLSDVAWLVGSWVGADDPNYRETWGPSSGRAMLGMCHMTGRSNTPVYEFMLLEERPGGTLSLHLQHFGANMSRLHAEPMALALTAVGPDFAVLTFDGTSDFHSPSGPRAVRIRYERLADDDVRATISHPGTENDRPIIINTHRAK